MENKHPHFALSSIEPSLKSLQGSVKTLLDSAGGTTAVLEDALGLINEAMTSQSVPLSLVEKAIGLLADGIKAKSNG